ncbi:TetR/AcrR family transcriptional regulator [Actinomadura sp. ATCC 31491]|uniref:TetR/AcrR family transcriptional regulator n=1 Tax=Actinomadura luzonensis TaxID=2805427 RepID=A0ABT0G9L0_9ACTN|nr:TetR/AcrR family transcriptional regulator [Actinomadura luzonensis]MCK2221284.1 TetR/AcrR family transcriptional regulator [Actinomadura luzonensis]
MDTAPAVGRRERKKAATRRAIADAALRLFLEHGYDRVSIKDIAEAADVSTTTLFKHFPGKEALVFDEEADREAELVAVVRDRPDGQGIVDALREHVLASWLAVAAHPRRAEFTALVDSTPALQQYAERMWTRHAAALAAAIAEDVGAGHDDITCHALARFVLEIPALTRGRRDLRAAVEEVFDLLTHGWRPPAPGLPPATDA